MTNKISKHPPSHEQALPAGTQLEEFVIERVLGVGGFGITYLAKDSSLGRQVVIKENLPAQFCWRDTHALTVRPRHTEGEDADNYQYSLESFRKEASTLASLDHPFIVKVLRSFQAHGTAYFVMPFVEGGALDEVIRQRTSQGTPFTEAEIQDLLAKVLNALGYLHERGIYHRDIKPGNILMTKAGPVLIDFGAARQRLSERSLTVIESAGYTPFEQLQSKGNIGPWSDLYALGGTLYKVITAEAPAKANDRAFDDPVMSLVQREELHGRYTPELLGSIDKAMSPKASDRFQDASQWFEQIGPPQRPGSLPPSITSRTAQPTNPSTTKSSALADGKRRSTQHPSVEVDLGSLRKELRGGYALTICGDAVLTFIQTTTFLFCYPSLNALVLAFALWMGINSFIGIKLAFWLKKPSLFMSFIRCAMPIIGMIQIICYHRQARDILAFEDAQSKRHKVHSKT
jgi:serine/threonine protein kinase